MSPSRVALQLGITYSSHLQRTRLNVETEKNNVSILHHVFFTFRTNQTFFFCGCNRAVCDQILEGDNFSTDEAAFKVTVDLAGSLRSFGAAGDGPCTNFRFACGEVGDETSR